MQRAKGLDELLNLPSGKPAAMPAAPEPAYGTDPEILAFDQLSPLPRPGDPYKAHSLPARGPVPTLHVLLRDASVRGFAYGNFDSIDLLPSDDAGSGPVIVVRFTGLAPCEVRIAGRNLDRLHSYLGYYRIPWIRELATHGDFIDKAEPLIRSVGIKSLERE